MQEEHLKMWLRESIRERKPNRTIWEAFVSMMEMTLNGCSVLEELTRTTMILLLKRKGG